MGHRYWFVIGWVILLFVTPTKGTDARGLRGPTGWPVIVAVCDPSPLPAKPGDQGEDYPSSKLEELILQLRSKPAKGEEDPVSLVKIGPNATQKQRDQIYATLRDFHGENGP